MIQGQELELSLGLPIEITSFNDRIPRLCYPFTLKTLKRANIYLSNFDHNDFMLNIEKESNMVALLSYLNESFKDEKSIEEILKHIKEDNFSELINDMKTVSGIIDSNGEIDISETKDILGWKKSINAIQTYTSNTYKDIQDMTLIQFNSLLPFVGTVINWEYKTQIISSVKDPDNFIDKDEYPLAVDHKVNNKKIMTMKDIEGFKNL